MMHGVVVDDPYRWLEDGASDEVRAWAAAQDALARGELARLEGRDALAARLRQLLYVEAVGVPVRRGGRYFRARRRADAEKSVVTWSHGEGGDERVLLDPASWSDDGSVALGSWSVSPDGRKIACAVKRNNSDEAELHVFDVDTGRRSVVDTIGGARYAHASWSPGAEGFYYTHLPDDPSVLVADRPGLAEVRYHRLGDDARNDVLVRERTGDPGRFVSAQVSHDGRWLLCTVQRGWSATDLYVRDEASGPGGRPFVPVSVGVEAIHVAVVYRDVLYIHTNEGAERWRVVRVDPRAPGREGWVEVVAEHPEDTLESMSIVGGRLVLSYLRDVASRIEIRELDGTGGRAVALPEAGCAWGLTGEEDDDEAWFAFSSLTRPTEVHAVSVARGESRRVTASSVPVDADALEVRQVFASSRDGTRVPMFVLTRRGQPRDGGAPALLTGYGGFQVAMTPMFRASAVAWVESGGVFALANLRGGSEYGESWHQGGMRRRKQNVFDDLVAAAEHLVSEGYCAAGRVAIQGASNGGLLVGAAMVQRPGSFAAVLCGVPLLDMVRYPLSGGGKTWVDEYGSPDDPDDFAALHAYSPYHRVVSGAAYPALLVSSADSDDRVDPLHARKFVALVQARSTGGPALLRVERNAGHGGADLMRSTVEKLADELAFALTHTTPSPRPPL